jgi:hypothetical protein
MLAARPSSVRRHWRQDTHRRLIRRITYGNTRPTVKHTLDLSDLTLDSANPIRSRLFHRCSRTSPTLTVGELKILRVGRVRPHPQAADEALGRDRRDQLLAPLKGASGLERVGPNAIHAQTARPSSLA